MSYKRPSILCYSGSSAVVSTSRITNRHSSRWPGNRSICGQVLEGDGPVRERQRFGPLLKQFRLTAGLTHEALAERALVSPRTVSDLERGVSRAPRLETINLICDALKLSPAKRAALAAAAHPNFLTASSVDPRLIVSGLPTPMTSFFGRETESRDLARLLRRPDVRLVTVTGPGGVGKTRLAVEVAMDLIHVLDDGIRYVSLAASTSRDDIIRAIARSIDVPDQFDSDPFDVLVQTLGKMQFLILLDNFEHLLEAASLISELLHGCPGLTILVTSRAPLRLSGEFEFPVKPLLTPDVDQLPSMEQIINYPAIALFIDRVSQMSPQFGLTGYNARAIATICDLLDGLPLALELAAPRMKLFTPEKFVWNLREGPTGQSLQLLSGGARDWPDRHQSLRDTLLWSYDLLAPSDRYLLRQLSVFVGGCTIDAAETICEPMSASSKIIDGLSALLDMSLIHQTVGPHCEPRIELLETIRRFSLEQLEHEGQAESVQRRHARYYLDMVEQTGGLLFAGARQRSRTSVEQANIQTALLWFVRHS